MRRPIVAEDLWLSDALRALGLDAQRVPIGPGDDAAWLRTGGDVVVTTDVIVDGVHFDSSVHDIEHIAWKAVAVNVSDLAAMGAEPLACVVGGVLSRPVERATFDALMAGLRKAATALGCPLIGGDTNTADGPLTLAVTALGRPMGDAPITRAGAQAGNRLSVTGALGGSLLERHLHVRPRLDAARALVATGAVCAMMDLSDGLARDLPRLARASGLAARLEAQAVPIHADVHRMASQGHPACREHSLAHALEDGEDFELLVAHRSLTAQDRATLGAAGVVLHPIGVLETGPAGRVLLVHGEGRAARVETLGPGGYDHLSP